MSENIIDEHAKSFDVSKLSSPEYSDWECHLFGMHTGIIVHPIKGNVPNFFWRWMQYLIFGNRWVKRKKDNNGNYIY